MGYIEIKGIGKFEVRPASDRALGGSHGSDLRRLEDVLDPEIYISPRGSAQADGYKDQPHLEDSPDRQFNREDYRWTASSIIGRFNMPGRRKPELLYLSFSGRDAPEPVGYLREKRESTAPYKLIAEVVPVNGSIGELARRFDERVANILLEEVSREALTHSQK